MGQGGGFQVGVDVLDDRVTPVGLIRQDGVAFTGGSRGDERVEAPGVEQRRLPVGLFRVQVGDTANDEAAGELVGRLLRGERREADLGDLGPGDPRLAGLVVDRVGVLDRRPRILGYRADGASDGRVHPHGDRHVRAGPPHRRDQGVGVERRIGPDQHVTARQPAATDQGERVADEAGRAAGRAGRPLAQPLGRDHRCDLLGGDARQQRVQAPDPGIADAAPCLW